MENSEPTVTIKCMVELYSDSMYSWAFHKTSRKETAEDLVQETFLALVQSFDRFNGDSNPKTYLFSILNKKISDHYRNSYSSHLACVNEIFETPFDINENWKINQIPQQWPDDTEHLLDNAEFQKTLQQCMGKLPTNWYSAIQLKFIKEHKSEHICRELGITNTNFWQILHRAKLQLRKCIESNWFKN